MTDGIKLLCIYDFSLLAYRDQKIKTTNTLTRAVEKWQVLSITNTRPTHVTFPKLDKNQLVTLAMQTSITFTPFSPKNLKTKFFWFIVNDCGFLAIWVSLSFPMRANQMGRNGDAEWVSVFIVTVKVDRNFNLCISFK